MKTSAVTPKITDKWPIEVPTHKYYSNLAVYKIWFGQRFLIWKGKSFLQSAESIATLLERALRLGVDSTNFLYHVAAYVKRARVIRATIEIVDIADFDDKDWMKYLQKEQQLLTAYKNDPDCLNNNFIAYVPEWMGSDVKVAFDKWLNESKRKKPTKKKKDAHA